MAKTKISEFSSTPANNTDIDSINIAEGCAPSGINNAIRELMAQLKDFQTGAAGDSFNGPVGTTTAAAGAFTTLSASGTVSGTGFSNYLASPPAIGGTTAAAGSFTTLTTSGAVTLNGGTANGVAYLNGSKVLTTGSALTFDGSEVFKNSGGTIQYNDIRGSAAAGTRMSAGGTLGTDSFDLFQNSSNAAVWNRANTPLAFAVNNSEQMRLTSTGLGIGTSSPLSKLTVQTQASARLSARTTDAVFGIVTGGNALDSLNGSDSALVPFGIRGSTLSFGTSAGLSATLDSSGNLGIGTSSPTEKLQVNGNILAGAGSQIMTASGAAQYGTRTANSVLFLTNNSEVMRLSADGNLGIGTSSPGARLQLTTSSSDADVLRITGGSSQQLDIGVNNSNGGPYIFSSGSFALRFGTNGSERARIDSSGNLGLGVTPSAWGATYKAFQAGTTNVVSGIASQTDNFVFHNFANAFYDGTNWKYIASQEAGRYELARNVHKWFTAPSGTAGNAISFTQVATLTSDGNYLVGTTDNSTGNRLVISGPMAYVNGASIPQVNYYSSASTIEFVNRDAGGSKTFSWYYQASGAGSPATLSTSGVWTNASDARGKENISDIHYGLDTVMALQPRRYDVKSDGSHAIGFVAQEVLSVVPELVHVTRRTGNDEFYGLDYGSMTAVLAKAIQELKAEFDAYKAAHP